jgi:hypothetical protein
VLVFLFHPVLPLTDHTDPQIRQKRGTRKGFFQDIVSLNISSLRVGNLELTSSSMALHALSPLTPLSFFEFGIAGDPLGMKVERFRSSIELHPQNCPIRPCPLSPE